ncbi:hypothetical protein [Haloferax sulfurifontis]|nr:hypothetical protein [Haloferax sulfurifontis]
MTCSEQGGLSAGATPRRTEGTETQAGVSEATRRLRTRDRPPYATLVD